MPPSWMRFRAYRTTVLTAASILSLVWSILIAIYTVKNWSSYESGQRGFFAGFVALDFVSSILIYLMIVVRFTYWPDVARTVALTGLHGAAAVVSMALKPHLPCNAFGGWTVCDRLTNAIIIGAWVITGLLAAYAICLPFVARSQGKTLESAVPDAEKAVGRTEQDRLVEDDKPPESPTTDAQAWLLKNKESMSPETIPIGLPRLSDNGRTHSPASSSLTSVALLPQPGARLSQGVTKNDARVARLPESAQWTSSSRNNDLVHTLSTPSALITEATTVRPSSPPVLPHPFAATAHSGVDPRGDNLLEEALFRMQQGSSVNTDGYETPSVYSQPSTTSQASTIRPTSGLISEGGKDLVDSPLTPVQGDMGADKDPKDGYLGPPLTAFPVSDYSGLGAAQTTFELQLSSQSCSPSMDASDFLNMATGVPRPHIRKDSAISIVDMDEWRKLVLGAAGKVQTTPSEPRPPSRDASELMNMAAGVPRPHTRKDSAISIVDMDEWRKLVLGAAGTN